MSNKSKKHTKFLAEAMGDKPVTDLPGIDKELGKPFKEAGYNKASEVYAKFLHLGKSKTKFQEWMKTICKDNKHYSEKYSKDCYKCLLEYSVKYGPPPELADQLEDLSLSAASASTPTSTAHENDVDVDAAIVDAALPLDPKAIESLAPDESQPGPSQAFSPASPESSGSSGANKRGENEQPTSLPIAGQEAKDNSNDSDDIDKFMKYLESELRCIEDKKKQRELRKDISNMVYKKNE